MACDTPIKVDEGQGTSPPQAGTEVSADPTPRVPLVIINFLTRERREIAR